MKTNILIIAIALVSLLVLVGCASSVEEVKTEENVGETVSVKGTVKSPIKLGDLSGYTLEDETGSIQVATQELPSEGEEVVAKGTLEKKAIIGYYIQTEE